MITDFTAPVVLHDNAPSTEDFCNRLHKQLMMQFKYAWVWGSSVRHQPQKVQLCIFVCPYVPCLQLMKMYSYITYSTHALSLVIWCDFCTLICFFLFKWRSAHMTFSNISSLFFFTLLNFIVVRQRSYISWRGCCTDC